MKINIGFFVSLRLGAKFFIAILASLHSFTHSAHAEIYKWRDENGKIHYSDTPPGGDRPTLEIKGDISSYDSPKIVPLADDFFTGTSATNKQSVVMYSAVWCGVCKRAKRYFAQNNISYTEYDIETSEKGKRDYQKLNGTGVPIILIGQKRMNGFSETRFQQLYNPTN